MSAATKSDSRSHRRIVIAGAGPAGLCMGIRLKQAGYNDFIILEKGDGVGGTWRANQYPGCACDLPSHLYSFSFEIKPDWSKPYGSQPEILEYLESVAEKYALLPYCRFQCEVRSASWDGTRALWQVGVESGEVLEADLFISSIGMFNEIAIPTIEGLGDFRGTPFHSARWRLDHDLTSERVGVIGSAASAVQFVPEIAKQAKQVHLFQRTANWVMPKDDEPYTEAQLQQFRSDPKLVKAIRQEIYDDVDASMTFSDPVARAERETVAKRAIDVVADPAIREKLLPGHPFGCKRPLFSNDYYPAFNRANLELVTTPIERIGHDSVITSDGRARKIDALILATGFEATRYLSSIDVRGRDGRSIEETWADGASAYLGVTTAGFPNLFMLYGPNTNNGSILTMIESQVDYIIRLIEWMDREDLSWIDVRPESMERFNQEIQAAISKIEVWQADCHGYYRSPSGRIVTQWPYSMTEYRRRTLEPKRDDFATKPTEAMSGTRTARAGSQPRSLPCD